MKTIAAFSNFYFARASLFRIFVRVLNFAAALSFATYSSAAELVNCQFQCKSCIKIYCGDNLNASACGRTKRINRLFRSQLEAQNALARVCSGTHESGGYTGGASACTPREITRWTEDLEGGISVSCTAR